PTRARAERRSRLGEGGEGFAVPPRPEGGDDRTFHVAEPETRRDGDRRQQVRGIEQADVELVAHVGPGHFANELDVEPFGGGKPLVDGDDQGRRVGERDESDPQPRFARDHFNSSAAVTTDWATSAIFLLSFIAVLRSRA